MSDSRSSSNSDWNSFWNLLSFLNSKRFFLLVALLILAVTTVIKLTIAQMSRTAVDALLQRERETFIFVMVALICLGIADGCKSGIWRYLRASYAGELASNMRSALAGKVLDLPLQRAEEFSAGELGSRITSDIRSSSQIIPSSYGAAESAALAVAASVYMILLSWRVGLAATIFTPLIGWVGTRLAQPIGKLSQQIQQGYADLSAFSEDSVANMQAVRAFNLHDAARGRFAHFNDSVLKRSVALLRQRALLEGAMWFFASAPLLIPFVYGGYLAYHGVVTPGTLMAVMYLTNYTRGPVASLGRRLGQIKQSLGSAEDVMTILAEVQEQAESLDGETGTEDAALAEYSLAVRDLNYSYSDDGKKALRDLSLEVPGDRRCFIVGESGSGKSTLLKLAAGLHPVQPGKIFLFGDDVCGTKTRSVYVPQDPYLFAWSIRQNLKLADSSVSGADIEAALQDSCAEFVYELPDKLDTRLSEGGSSLSGGQRARLCIARALLHRPEVLFLDEPGASLDAETEAELMKRLTASDFADSLIVVSHRLSPIKAEDHVVFLSEGRMLGSGRHTKLLEENSEYRRVYTQSVSSEFAAEEGRK